MFRLLENSSSTTLPEGQGSYHSDTQSDATSWTAGTSNSQVDASPIGALLTRGCVKGSTQESVVAEQAMLLELPRARSCCSTEACEILLLLLFLAIWVGEEELEAPPKASETRYA